MLHPAGRTPFVGRERESRVLTEALARIRAGDGGAVLVAGEAGIGKSRLIAELRLSAEAGGVVVLRGACFEPDRAVPYAPFADLFRTALDDHLDGNIDALAPELLALLPEHAAGAATSASNATGDPEQDKRRLFAIIAAALVAIASGRPLMVCIEDLH
jgi:predicted ATPase